MGIQSVTPVLNVSSVGESLVWFEKLGWTRGFTWNEGGLIGEGAQATAANDYGPAGFGSVCSGKGTIFLCCGGQGSRGTIWPRFPGDDQTDGVWMSWWMDSPTDVDALYATAQREGMSVTSPPTNEPWGVREFHLRHPDGHMFRVSAGLS
ncbi:MAG: VOC family protein, partial [Planctomycetales bacterium]